VGAYPDLAEWRSVVLRLLGFEQTLARVRADAAVRGLHSEPGAARRVPQGGRPLVEGVTMDIRPGDTALISGPSGAGKSTLFRAIAGIWPFGRGDIRPPL